MDVLHAIKHNQITAQPTVAELVDAHGDSVYHFCRSLTFSKETADDLFQETFLKALEQMPKVIASGDPRGFLLSISAYIWKSWKRKHTRRDRLAPSEPLTDAVSGGTSVEEEMLEQEQTRAVRRLIDTLPDKLKIPVVLYYALDMRVPDIALSLKIPAGTVKSRLFKARKIIEKGLTEYENND